MADPRIARFRSMLDGRRLDELCPEPGQTWTRLGAYCTGLLDQVTAGTQLHPIPGHLRPSIARLRPVRVEPRQPPVTKEPRMSPTVTIPITLDQAVELLRAPGTVVALEATAPGVIVTVTAVMQGAPETLVQRPVTARTPAIRQKRGRSSPGTAEAHACPDCPASFAKPQALGAHRARKHGYRTAPKVDVPVSRRVTPPTDNGNEPTPPPMLQEPSTPIGRMKFDPDRTRAAAAASI